MVPRRECLECKEQHEYMSNYQLPMSKISNYIGSFVCRIRTVFSIITAIVVLMGAATAGTGPGSKKSPKKYLDELPANVQCVPGTIIVKLKTRNTVLLKQSAMPFFKLSGTMERYGVVETKQMFPGRSRSFAPDSSEIGIDRMYRVTFTSDASPMEVARAFNASDDVEYAEPELIRHVFYIPNDPMLSQQYAIDLIHAREAWDITTGSRDVVIGIVDTGVLWTHEDLKDNIWINPGEDIDHDGKYTLADLNGIDDDGNGYVDDLVGIDFVGDKATNGGDYYDNNPLPTSNGNPHGTHVAGIAAAVGNNGKGIAGVAFNCRIMPVKCGSDDGANSVLRGYDGIVYAAENGAKIINCSWGGGGYVQNEVDRINYAISKGALVVAAAGNDASETQSTPGAYPNVLCVANSNQNDLMDYSTTYGSWVDVSAPGTSILSTVSSAADSYESAGWTGTSMASPCTAGVAALVASRFPAMTPTQIMQKVRVTADPIDALQQPRYERKTGFGRINALRALTVSSPAFMLKSWSFRDDRTGNGNGIIDRGETIEVVMHWTNELDSAKHAVFTLSSNNANLAITQNTFDAGAVGTGVEVGNDASPFIVTIKDKDAPNDRIDLNYDVVDGAYRDFGGVITYQQPTYRDHDVNNITVTLSNDGNVGFDDFSGTRGKGFILKGIGTNVLFEGAVMIGARPNGLSPVVVDVARDESGSFQCTDLAGLTQFVMRTPGPLAPQEGSTAFDDRTALDPLQIRVDLRSYEFTKSDWENFVILKYTITNNSSCELVDMYVGLFCDWDIGSNSHSDRAYWDQDLQTFYAYDSKTEARTVAGGTVLTREAGITYCGINNADGAGEPPQFGIYDGFTKDEKWRSMSYGVIQQLSKISDVSTVISNGPYNLEPGDSVTVAFALFGAAETGRIMKDVPEALEAWKLISQTTGVEKSGTVPSGIGVESVHPNPLTAGSGTCTVTCNLDRVSSIRFEVVDMLGRIVHVQDAGTVQAGRHRFGMRLGRPVPGVYLVRMISDIGVYSAKLSVLGSR
jgi:subtilisin family serine protease